MTRRAVRITRSRLSGLRRGFPAWSFEISPAFTLISEYVSCSGVDTYTVRPVAYSVNIWRKSERGAKVGPRRGDTQMKLSPESLARASSRHPWRTLGIWLVLIAAMGAISSALLSGVLSQDI